MTEPWQPDKSALSIVQRPDPAGEGPTTFSVRHPTAPFKRTLKIEKNGQGGFDYAGAEFEYRNLIHQYLVQLLTKLEVYKQEQKATLALSQAWLSLEEWVEKQIVTKFPDNDVKNAENPNQGLAWLPLTDETNPNPYSSFWFPEDGKDERTLVMSATVSFLNVAGEKLLIYPNGSGIGIRVVAHLSPLNEEFRITSMSASLLGGDSEQLPQGPSKRDLVEEPKDTTCDERNDQPLVVLTEGVSSGAQRSAVPSWEVFLQDPVSRTLDSGAYTLRERRPTGDEATLQRFLEKAPSAKSASIAKDAGGAEPGLDRQLLRVMPSKFVRDDPDVQSVGGGPGRVRSDTFSAISGLHNPLQLFERFKRYSINPNSYFRSAELPLDVHYRSGMPYGPGKDGQTVNAAVQPIDWRRHQIAPDPDQPPPRLQLHLALANLSHRGRDKWDGKKRSPAEPLGIAADPRWMWHELGHVLLMASTGELEMRFAHSPGDALAAIVADPESDLVEDESADEEESNRKRRWRGATFPWVYIPRRHDRCVYHGWSWSGAMHRPLRELPDAKQPRRKGYRSEQILSTSLFRLYLCLGGHTTVRSTGKPDVERRRAASNYAVYLIIKGLGLLGDARIVPANDPDQLVSALIDADIGTEEFNSGQFKRIGGCAHKAIRWAFEAQGLYAGGAADNNDIGSPPEGDVYIEDRRSTTETWGDCPVEHGPGSYVPVSLERSVSGDGDLPEWFADDSAIKVTDEGVNVIARSRGSQDAKGVTVTLYYKEWKKGAELPVWVPPDWVPPSKGGQQEQPPESWHKIDPMEADRKQTNSGTKDMEFGPFNWLPPVKASRLLILAQVTCPGDRANTDPASHLPCSRTPTPLADLVANDNNLGLIAWSPSEKRKA